MATREEHKNLDINRDSLNNIVANYKDVEQGLAQKFRETINDNFDETKEVVQEIVEDIKAADVRVNEIVEEIWGGMVNIQLSENSPPEGTQQQGDFWFKIIKET